MQRDEAFRRILAELDARDHAWVAVEHAGKARATSDATSTHWHLVVAHVGGDGRALNLSGSYARLEAVARACERDFGEPATRSRRAAAVAVHLTRMGRADVAKTLWREAVATTPRSAMSSPGRQRAARLGVDLPAARAAVRAAWAAPDLVAALAAAGLRIGLGDRRRIPSCAGWRMASSSARSTDWRALRAWTSSRGWRLTWQRERGPQGRKEKSMSETPEARGTGRCLSATAKDLARRGGDEGSDGGDSGDSDAGRAVPGPRLARQNRSGAANASDDPAAAAAGANAP